MTATTRDQDYTNTAWVGMSNKLDGAKLQFSDCYNPASGTMWKDSTKVRVNVYDGGSYAWVTVKWFLGENYKNIKYIGLHGIWHVNGIYPNQNLHDPVYNIDIPQNSALHSEMKTGLNQNNVTRRIMIIPLIMQ